MEELTSFCAAVADVLEVESIGPGDAFRDVPGWCSLKAFGLLVTLENDWWTPLAIDRFQELKTVRDLWNEVSVLRVPHAQAGAPEGRRTTDASPVSRLTPPRENTNS